MLTKIKNITKKVDQSILTTKSKPKYFKEKKRRPKYFKEKKETKIF